MAAPTKVQSSGQVAATTVTSISKSFGSLPTAGNFIVVAVHQYGGLVIEDGLTDNQGNTYTLAVQGASPSSPKCAIFYCANIGAPSGTFTFTYDMGSLHNAWMVAEEWTNMPYATAVTTSSNDGGSGTTITAGPTASVTPAADGALVVALASVVTAAGGLTVETVSPAWVQVGTVTTPYFAPVGMGDARVVTGVGTQSCNWTAPEAGTTWSACIAVFAPGVAPPISNTTVFGSKGTAISSLTFLANLDNTTRTVDEPNTFYIGGKLIVTGTATLGGVSYGTTTTGQIGSTTVAAGSSGTAKTLNWNDGNNQLLTLTGNATLTLTNPKDGYVYLLALKQDATGSRTVTWPASVKWAGGTAPTLTTTAGRVDLIRLTYFGGLGASGNYLAESVLNYTPA